MKYYLPLLLLLTASACSTVRTLPVQDSTRVEVRYETKTVHDTAYVELPVIVEKVATLDTASLLENKYAKSAASVSGGVLAHSLETKPVRWAIRHAIYGWERSIPFFRVSCGVRHRLSALPPILPSMILQIRRV